MADDIPEGAFPNLGNVPLLNLRRLYVIPERYKNICLYLQVPLYFYYAFKYYINVIESLDCSLLDEIKYYSKKCLIHDFKIFDIYDDEYCILFYYMIIRSYNIFRFDRYPFIINGSRNAPAG